MTIKVWQTIPILVLCAWLGSEIQSNRQKVIRVYSDTDNATTRRFQTHLEKYLEEVEIRLRRANSDLSPGSVEVEIHQIRFQPSAAYQVVYKYRGDTVNFTVVETDAEDVDDAAKGAASDIDRGMLVLFYQMKRSQQNPDSLRACRGFGRPGTKKPAWFGGVA